ncbi:MAG: amidohydrolase family protein [Rhizobiales bacterium]|nr:amidohydrolase family protein [Hyphomicrobiales bacterium]
MSLIRPVSGAKPKIVLPKGAIDAQMHAYMPGFPALPGGPGLPAGDLPTPEQYRQFMDWIGIERVIVTQGMAHQLDNNNLVACLERFGDIAWGVAMIDATTSEAELDRLSAARVRGARIMNLPGGAANLTKLEEVDAIAASRDWMIAIQFDGSDILDYEERLSQLKSRWVLDHHGKFFCGVTPDSPQVQATKRLIDGGRCWFKFAGVYESSKSGGPEFADVAAVARAIAAHAPERIVWGTNWPHNMARAQADYPDDAALADTVLGWLPDEKARRLALVDNPEELFAIAPAAGR